MRHGGKVRRREDTRPNRVPPSRTPQGGSGLRSGRGPSLSHSAVLGHGVPLEPTAAGPGLNPSTRMLNGHGHLRVSL